MIPFIKEIDNVKEQIIEKYNPLKIILFGSCAKGIAKDSSDIDLCVICEYESKKDKLMDMLINIQSDRAIDFILYRPREWEKYIEDSTTFASLIKREGVVLYG
ncbi:MAG: nucleotidyltransferase domain-containing protein [Clostridium sp.]|uniref:nucleotidyltransferase domain-containing protein n=1 Tax=Clostridium sp. TaxID=1506 RepID=UPI002A8C8A90|nr:nucleotidyltransferase domain-containing protein [Clostridium sp.]MDY5097440.1 nucleotidyltransferase domain-containing protein [Clostridium sp.]